MACTSFPPPIVVRPRPKERELRLVLAAASATLFSVVYAGFVVLEAARPVRSGSLALHVVGLAFSFVASIGGWSALSKCAWGLSLVVLAARGNLLLLAFAIALAAWDAWAGQGPRDPIILLAALGAIQAATVILAAPAGTLAPHS
jgi:hypothetical protein